MKTIEITDHDFERLKAFAEPFVDTPATTVARILDIAEAIEQKSISSGDDHLTLTFTLSTLPDLTHTKLLEADFGGTPISKPTWDSLLQRALSELYRKSPDISDMITLSSTNIVLGDKCDEGYRPLAGTGLSYQRQSAADIARSVAKIARQTGAQVYLLFQWRDKPEAAHPGKMGRVGTPSTLKN